MKPLVSVIMNCFNGDKFLKRSVKSVLNQSYKNIELIFWDNLSTDKSEIIIKKFKDKRIKYFKSKKFLTLYNARNFAIKKAKGNFISFLDADDWWDKNKIKKQLDILKKNTKIDIVYSNYYIFNHYNKKKRLVSKNLLPEGFITQNLLDNYRVGILTVLIKKKIFLKEKFNKNYNIIGDFDFIIRISEAKNFLCIQQPLAYYRVHANNYSTKNLNLQFFELYEWLKKNKIIFNKKGYSLKYQILILVKIKIKIIVFKILSKFNFFLGV